MKCNLVGFKTLDFTDNAGKEVKGIKLFLAYPDTDVTGNATEDVFIRQNLFDTFGLSLDDLSGLVDTVINIEYGRKGKILGLTV